jgi:hypothetical protein
MNPVTVHIKKEEGLERFLTMNHFQVEALSDNVHRVQRADEVPVFLNITDNTIFFEVDLGGIKNIGSEKFYFDLLNLNTEIQPVSFGINNSQPEDPRLVLNESRETTDLDDHELLSVFDALELAVDKAETLLQPILGQV